MIFGSDKVSDKPLKFDEGSLSPMTGELSRFIFTHKVLGKYDANYFFDPKCGYVFVQSPFWLKETYDSAISALDTGLLARNIRNIKVVTQSIFQDALPCSRGVDLGGGLGVFVRGMRDSGFDFYWTDAYADNVLARGFEGEFGDYDIAVAFEVLEHTENPIAFLTDAKARYNFSTCFFSATCFPEDAVPSPDWWYWVFDTGQHISFFSLRSLQWMAKGLGMDLYHVQDDIYAFSIHRISSQHSKSFSLLRRVARKLFRITSISGGKSLTMPDHFLLRDRVRREQGIDGSQTKYPDS
jgi:Methyltransferase domain